MAPVKKAAVWNAKNGAPSSRLRCRHRIAAHHRHAVVETVLRDRLYADVAADLGVPPGTLRTRVHYGLRRLRCALENADAAA